jgi:prolyl-tRNA editing enzyme YbaK/EbsC (Cys-tRNA(Pro) deacylase)
MDTAVSLTGMQHGGITGIGPPADWPILIDRSVSDQERVIVGRGIRGLKILATPDALTSLRAAEVLAITKTGQPVRQRF